MYQVHKCYGDVPPPSSTTWTPSIFRATSDAAAEEVSKRIGDATIGIATYNESDGMSHPTGSGPQGPTPGSVSCVRSFNYSETARRLIKPEELITMGEDFQVLFHRNCRPVAAQLVRHDDAPEFRRGGTGRRWDFGLVDLAARRRCWSPA